jgi:hypothetical protein
VIDLSELAKPGDTVQFRFDFGMDGCNGIDGWYIDNVALSVCTAPAAGTVTVAPVASARKGTVRIHITVAGGGSFNGQVMIRIKKRHYTATAVDGVVTFKARKQLKRLWKDGKRTVTANVRYTGDATVAPFFDKVPRPSERRGGASAVQDRSVDGDTCGLVYASTTTGMIIGRRLWVLLTQRPIVRRMTCCSW